MQQQAKNHSNREIENLYQIVIKPNASWADHKDLIRLLTTENSYFQTAISFGSWDTINMKDKCPDIIQWTVQRLYLFKNNNPDIIRDIANIKSLPALNQVNLTDNNIDSIQLLTRSCIPSLRKLYLVDNLITNISSFRKCNFQYMVTLELNKNRVVEIIDLSEYHNQYFQTLKLDCLESQIPWKQNCGYKLKWETTKLKEYSRGATYLSLNLGTNYMRPKTYYDKIQETFIKKYPKIKVWVMKY